MIANLLDLPIQAYKSIQKTTFALFINLQRIFDRSIISRCLTSGGNMSVIIGATLASGALVLGGFYWLEEHKDNTPKKRKGKTKKC